MAALDPSIRRAARPFEWTARRALRLGQGLAFWVAVALPVVYLPAIVGGLVHVEATTLVVLVAVNYLALFVGAGYGNPVRTSE